MAQRRPEHIITELKEKNLILSRRVGELEKAIRLFIQWLKMPTHLHFAAIKNTCNELLREPDSEE